MSPKRPLNIGLTAKGKYNHFRDKSYMDKCRLVPSIHFCELSLCANFQTCTLNPTSRFWWGVVIFVTTGVKQSQLRDYESWSSLTTKNGLRFINWNLYGMGPLTLVRWLLWRGFKVWAAFRTRIQAGKGPPPKKNKERKKISMSPIHLSDKIQGFKPIAIDTTLFPP